jgi:hypothetical protein
VKINQARGEVPFEAAGQKFVLVATAENLAALEVQSGAYGFKEIVRRLEGQSLHTVRQALMCMDKAVSDPVVALKKVKKLNTHDLIRAGTAVTRAIMFELTGEAEKKDSGARETS